MHPLAESSPLPQLLKKTGLWRASQLDCEFRQGTPTGYALLDQHLPGAGWPTEGVAEILHDQQGIGELRLLSPALAYLSQQQRRWQLWVSPPYLPYAPALVQAGINPAAVLVVRPSTVNDSLWAMEQALASQSCSAVLAWPGKIQEKQVRRLQLASKAGHCLGVLFRPAMAAQQPSPAELRLQVRSLQAMPLRESSALEVKVLKRRGGWSSNPFVVEFNDRLNQVTPDFADMPVRNPARPAPELAFIEPQRYPVTHDHQQQ